MGAIPPPGIILYLTYWFRQRERAQAIALFLTGLPITSILGAPISGVILDHVHSADGRSHTLANSNQRQSRGFRPTFISELIWGKVRVARFKLDWIFVKADLKNPENDPFMKFGYGGTGSNSSIPVVQLRLDAVNRLLKPTLGKTITQLEAAIDDDMKPRSALVSGWKAEGVTTIDRSPTKVKNVIGL